eukprot:TRINITY_DN6375_c0_g1_i1.p1 TRINITY_DN6375_c0_g1~~TRINITY_DN6375_c0_g1_i1.p1  ORF type:complete len:213 (+),score=4.52 TRINITY_DN6375_c0_g1_i1:786-1424(+)
MVVCPHFLSSMIYTIQHIQCDWWTGSFSFFFFFSLPILHSRTLSFLPLLLLLFFLSSPAVSLKQKQKQRIKKKKNKKTKTQITCVNEQKRKRREEKLLFSFLCVFIPTTPNNFCYFFFFFLRNGNTICQACCLTSTKIGRRIGFWNLPVVSDEANLYVFKHLLLLKNFLFLFMGALRDSKTKNLEHPHLNSRPLPRLYFPMSRFPFEFGRRI